MSDFFRIFAALTIDKNMSWKQKSYETCQRVIDLVARL